MNFVHLATWHHDNIYLIINLNRAQLGPSLTNLILKKDDWIEQIPVNISL